MGLLPMTLSDVNSVQREAFVKMVLKINVRQEQQRTNTALLNAKNVQLDSIVPNLINQKSVRMENYPMILKLNVCYVLLETFVVKGFPNLVRLERFVQRLVPKSQPTV